MTPAQRVVLAAIDAINAGRTHLVAELVAPDLADHGAGLGGRGYGDEVRYEVHDVFSAGDRVALRATVRGLHGGDVPGFTATGRPFAVPTMHICRVDGGRLAEHWSVRDDLTLLRQVGAV